MTTQNRISRPFHLLGYSLLLLILLGWLLPGHAAAAPAAAGPLPLPDLLIYGKVTNATGDPLESGTIKALLHGQTIASAQIRGIRGTGYTYLLVVPTGMVAPGSTDRDSRRVIAGDLLTFTVDDRPAYYQDSATSLTVDQLRVPAGAAGSSVVLDLALPDAMRYLIGDVNANGARNAADAMLTLKYDIGLIHGVTSFPPGPNTVYLPLCDIVENGRCDSSDALRILQCDVGLAGVTCPTETIGAVNHAGANGPASAQAAQPAEAGATPDGVTSAAGGDPIGLQVAVTGQADEQTGGQADAGDLQVRVLLTQGANRFGAGSFELQYDPALLTPTECTGDPGDAFDMVVCNLDYAPGVVRFNAVATGGADNPSALASLRFQPAQAAPEQIPAFILTADSVTDTDGAGLDWRVTTTDEPATPDQPAPDQPALPNEPVQHQIFLPTIGSPGQTSAPQPQGAPNPIFLPAICGPDPTSSAQPSQDQPPQDQPTQKTEHWLFLPAVGGQCEVGEAGASAPTPELPEPMATPEALPAPEETPPLAPPVQESPPVADPDPIAPPEEEAWQWEPSWVAILPSDRTAL